MAEPNTNPAEGGTDPKPVDHLAGAPLPNLPTPAAQTSPAGQVLESPQEARRRAEHDKNLHEGQEAGAALAATGLGCLSLALLPWSIGIVVLVAVLLMWLFHGK